MRGTVFRWVASGLVFGGILSLVAAIMWRPVLQQYWMVPEEFIWFLFILGAVSTPTGLIMCAWYACLKHKEQKGQQRQQPQQHIQQPPQYTEIDMELQNALNLSLQEAESTNHFQTVEINRTANRSTSGVEQRPSFSQSGQPIGSNSGVTPLLIGSHSGSEFQRISPISPPPYSDHSEKGPPPAYGVFEASKNPDGQINIRDNTPPPHYEDIMHEV